MKPTAFHVNIARGLIAYQGALANALERDPVDPHDPPFALAMLILSPHAIAFTDEVHRTSGESSSRAVIALADGPVPEHIVDRAALSPRLAAHA